MKRADRVRRTWSKMENRKREVEKVVMNLKMRISLERRRCEERDGRLKQV